MKLLVHPEIKDITLEGILYALGDKQRLQIVKNHFAGKWQTAFLHGGGQGGQGHARIHTV